VCQSIQIHTLTDSFLSLASLGTQQPTTVQLLSGQTQPIPMEQIITFVARQNNHTIVVAVAPGPIRTDPWRDQVNSILLPFLPGEQYGNAIADLIFGDEVPQAKLPVTLPLHDDDQGM
jgi:beta-glucosidase